jgi:hypothetical protein
MGSDIAGIRNSGVKSKHNTILTTFYGGDILGEMIQITQGLGSAFSHDEPGFIQLSSLDTYILISHLTTWLKDTLHRKATVLKHEIESRKELQKSIFEETVKCEKFIQDLENLDIPISLLNRFGINSNEE